MYSYRTICSFFVFLCSFGLVSIDPPGVFMLKTEYIGSPQQQNVTAECFDCDYDYSCSFGQVLPVKCTVREQPQHCLQYANRRHNLNYTCAYCYQFHEEDYICTPSYTCKANAKYLAECSMKSHVLCLGNRTFHRYRNCNIVVGHKWSTALLLSISLGGWGTDRFYLGYWQEGMGKIFSFGGFGVWTLVDIILIATGYLKPADGSRYIQSGSKDAFQKVLPNSDQWSN